MPLRFLLRLSPPGRHLIETINGLENRIMEGSVDRVGEGDWRGEVRLGSLGRVKMRVEMMVGVKRG